ncbi:collagen-like protein [Lactiplantibacillus plantarum]|uniref:collagen-like protein n=1 Tax=Lactiplantibacillus plantarum TaxID=1590 RepID=UPI002E7A5F8A|nr:collagen-like protein [Lactiplantibacillus plantarum]WVI01177.1 collagen-like protein [Lactiplantibacillus plantarum]
MTKTLDFAYETTHEIKVGDDETTFTLVCKNEDLPVDLTVAKSITAKIGSHSGYLREQPISIDNLAKLPTGQFKFNFDKDTLANFPTGNYFLEVWVTDAQGTSIYPSGNPLRFTVTANIENSSGATITTITFDDFVKAMNKAASTIAKGDKGDDGLSAYQIAVINGYHGSQTDWLASLVGATGLKGDKGDAGKDFQIVKTFPSIATMNGDGFSDGDFTMIASDVNDPDDGKLYVWNGTSFTYIADLSGSQGIKGDTGKTGDKGDKGDTGDQGLSAYQVAVNAGFSGSVNQWLASLVGAKGDKGDKGADAVINIISQAAYDALSDKTGVYFIEG